MQERHTDTEFEMPNKISFSIIIFVTSIISLLVTILVINILCKHKKLKILVDSLALQQIKEVGVVATWEPL